MKVTSITIGGTEWVSKTLAESTAIEWQTGGNIANATLVVQSTPTDINSISAQDEVVIYCGGSKLYGGYISRIEPQAITPSLMRATLTCQDYSVLLDRVFISSEEYTSQTDESILDDLFSTYLSEISTADVNTVKTLDSITFENVTLRHAVEMIVDRSGADWYVDAEKHLQYWDPSAAAESPILLHEAVSEFGDWDQAGLGSWTIYGATYSTSTGKLAEDATTGNHYFHSAEFAADASAEYTIEVKAKAAERTQIQVADRSFTHFGKFDLSAGTLLSADSGTEASITEVDTGTYLCQIRFPSAGTTESANVFLAVSGTNNYAGTAGYGAYIYSVRFADGDGFLLDSFQYSKDFTTPANKVTVAGELAQSTTTISSTITVNGDNGIASIGSSSAWPPSGTVTTSTPAVNHNAGMIDSTPTYSRNVCLLRFDTSAVPADVLITSARLYLTCSGADIIDTATNCEGLGIEWYDSSNWPIDTSDYTNTPSNSAWGYSKLNPTNNTVSVFELVDGDSHINRSGYTGLRIHTKFSGTPDGWWRVNYFASNEANETVPRLEVTYIQKIGPSATVNDTSSQSNYGKTFERTIVDTSISTSGEATLRANVELARYAWPQESGSVTFRSDGLDIKDTLRIVSTAYSIDSAYAVRRISARWLTPELTEYIAEFGDWRPDLIKMLRQMAQKVG